MKKRLLSILTALALCLTLLPMAALAEEGTGSKTVIASVDDLKEFAAAVDRGEYEDPDTIVSLESDLDLSGINWKPIGNVAVDPEGNVSQYFGGKFYGNGHTISNIDFSSCYGKKEYASVGFFSKLYGAEVSGLTIQGTIDVTSECKYNFFGVFAGAAFDCTISDCVSNVSFRNNGNRVHGTVGLIGQAINDTIEYCQNIADITLAGDNDSIYAGGIAGYAGTDNGTTEIRYCSNTGNMTLGASHGGGIAGQLGSDSTIDNCYSTGKFVAIGNNELGGIAGTISDNTTIKHCYFSGEIDLSQFDHTTYSRFGGISSNISSSSAFENNYFTAKDATGEMDIPSCGFKNTTEAAGTAKTPEYMMTEAFYNELKTGGGDYLYQEGRTPIIPRHVTSIALDKSALTLTVGATGKLTATVSPDNATDKSVTWSSDNEPVATVSDDGTVTAVAAGTATITVTTTDGGKTASCTVTVNAPTPTPTVRDDDDDDDDPSYPVTVPGRSSMANGSIQVTPRNAEKGSRVTITVTPDPGYVLGSLSVTDYKGNALTLTDAGDGKYTFLMPGSAVKTSVSFVPEAVTPAPGPDQAFPFADVKADAYYREAVRWAVDEGITSGTSATTFGPDLPCDRGQIVTFLWRAAGSPAPTGALTFTDVAEGSYCADAVRWAAENGIASGTSKETFSPDLPCTRAQMAAFLYRSQKSPAVSGSSAFTDVNAGDYFHDAVLWAAQNGITSGISATAFGPDLPCSRAQMVMFLYRLMGK